MSIGIHIGKALTLTAGTTDSVQIVINDNLTGGGANEFNYLQASLLGELGS